MYTILDKGLPEFSAAMKERILALPAGADLPVIFGSRNARHGIQSMHLDARSAADFLTDALPVEVMPAHLALEWLTLDESIGNVLDWGAFARLRIFRNVPAFVLIPKAAA